MRENEGLWELYGLKTNPFSTSPLLVKGGLLPIESFYGRENELKRLKKMFNSSGGSRILVCGDVGVGKTSFVNFSRYLAMKSGHFTPFKEIAVQTGWDSNSFILNTLYAIYSTLKLRKEEYLKKETMETLETLVQLPTSKMSVSGVNIADSGFGFNEIQTTGKSISSIALSDLFQKIIHELVKKTGKDIIIHYNNLERMKEKVLRELFEDLRDFFQCENVHFVFVGNLTVHSVFQSMPRVSSIISDTPLLINEFLFEEIEQIISIRIKKLRISEDLNYMIPLRTEALKTLFELYGGNIRNILNSLSTAIVEVVNEKPIIMDHNLLASTLKSLLEKRYLVGVQPRAKDVLSEAVKHNEITNRHLSHATKIARSNISTYVRELEKHGCLYLRRRDGKDKYWSVEPKIKWMLLKTVEKRQGELEKYMKPYKK